LLPPLVEKLFVLEILGDLRQPLEVIGLLGVFIDDQRLLAFGIIRPLRRLFGDVRVMSPRFGLVFAKLENRIRLEFLLNAFLQRHQRQLENLHALDHARREELALRPISCRIEVDWLNCIPCPYLYYTLSGTRFAAIDYSNRNPSGKGQIAPRSVRKPCQRIFDYRTSPASSPAVQVPYNCN